MRFLLVVVAGGHDRATDETQSLPPDQPIAAVSAEGDIPAIRQGVVVTVAPTERHATAFGDLVLASPAMNVTLDTAGPAATRLSTAAARLTKTTALVRRSLLEPVCVDAIVFFAQLMIFIVGLQIVDGLCLGISADHTLEYSTQIGHIGALVLPRR
jgi:hypothetical protein